jgi:hypothetical protein
MPRGIILMLLLIFEPDGFSKQMAGTIDEQIQNVNSFWNIVIPKVRVSQPK